MLPEYVQIDIRNQNNEIKSSFTMSLCRRHAHSRCLWRKTKTEKPWIRKIITMLVRACLSTWKTRLMNSGIPSISIDSKLTAKSVQSGILHWWPRKMIVNAPQNWCAQFETLYFDSEQVILLTLNQIINFEFGTSASQSSQIQSRVFNWFMSVTGVSSMASSASDASDSSTSVDP